MLLSLILQYYNCNTIYIIKKWNEKINNFFIWTTLFSSLGFIKKTTTTNYINLYISSYYINLFCFVLFLFSLSIVISLTPAWWKKIQKKLRLFVIICKQYNKTPCKNYFKYCCCCFFTSLLVVFKLLTSIFSKSFQYFLP